MTETGGIISFVVMGIIFLAFGWILGVREKAKLAELKYSYPEEYRPIWAQQILDRITYGGCMGLFLAVCCWIVAILLIVS